MISAIKISKTIELIAQCWDESESNLRESIREKHRNPSEEFITQFFCGELSFSLRKASELGLIREAFLRDLHFAFPSLETSSLQVIAENLIADVSLHKRHIEKFTGGDFGLTITRPDIALRPPANYTRTGYLDVIENYQRGLLCQAKLKQSSGWGKLTPNQKRIIPDKLNFLGLLLYECGGTEKNSLNQFTWQLCNNATVEMVCNWLKSGEFPSSMSSSQIIKQLGNAKIGTDNKEVLEQIIRPSGKPQFNIRIYWPPDKKPPNSLTIVKYSTLKTKVKVQQMLIGKK